LRRPAKPDIFERIMSHTGQISLSFLTSPLLAGLLLRGRAH
jgi:hypothetical protein